MKTSDFRYSSVCFVAFGLLLVSGCGPETAQVSGRVTFDGKPIGKGEIITFPQDLPEGIPMKNSSGQIVDGEYTLSTYGIGDGAQPATHKVVMTNYEDTTGGPQIPPTFGNITTTPVAIQIKSGVNRIDIEIAEHL
ncbi:MAG: hypothetical protein MK102_14135 [Fuerstiella sp.]|nr:hypothetical protein [Fuerstiella sp.]